MPGPLKGERLVQEPHRPKGGLSWDWLLDREEKLLGLGPTLVLVGVLALGAGILAHRLFQQEYERKSPYERERYDALQKRGPLVMYDLGCQFLRNWGR